MPSRDPHLPTSPTKTSPKEDHQGSEGSPTDEGRQGGGGETHRKQHCSWSRDSKKHRMPSSAPAIVAVAVAACSLAHSFSGGGGASRPEARRPCLSPTDQLLHFSKGCRLFCKTPQSCLMPRLPVLGHRTLVQMEQSPLPPPPPGSLLPIHTQCDLMQPLTFQLP